MAMMNRTTTTTTSPTTIALLLLVLLSTVLFTFAALRHNTPGSNVITFHNGVLNKDEYPSILPHLLQQQQQQQQHTQRLDSTSHIYLIELQRTANPAQWATLFAPYYLATIPRHIFLVQCSEYDLAALLRQTTSNNNNNNNNGRKNAMSTADLAYIHVLPPHLKQSTHLTAFLNDITMSSVVDDENNNNNHLMSDNHNFNPRPDHLLINIHKESGTTLRQQQQQQQSSSSKPTLNNARDVTSLFITELTTTTPLTAATGLSQNDMYQLHTGDTMSHQDWATYHFDAIMSYNKQHIIKKLYPEQQQQLTQQTNKLTAQQIENEITTFVAAEVEHLSQSLTQQHQQQILAFKKNLIALQKIGPNGVTTLSSTDLHSSLYTSLQKQGFDVLFDQDNINIEHFLDVIKHVDKKMTTTTENVLLSSTTTMQDHAILPFHHILSRSPDLPSAAPPMIKTGSDKKVDKNDTKTKQQQQQQQYHHNNTIIKSYQHIQFQAPIFYHNATTLYTIFNQRMTLMMNALDDFVVENEKAFLTMSSSSSSSSQEATLSSLQQELLFVENINEYFNTKVLSMYQDAYNTKSFLLFNNNKNNNNQKRKKQYLSTNQQHMVYHATIQHFDKLIVSAYQLKLQQYKTQLQNILHSNQKQQQKQQKQLLFSTTLLTFHNNINNFLIQYVSYQTMNYQQLLTHTIHTQFLTHPHLYYLHVPTPIALHSIMDRYVLQIGHAPQQNGEYLPPQEQFSTMGPYFDNGINGNNVILSMADTGIDMNSCFFRDENKTHVIPFSSSLGKDKRDLITEHRKIQAYWALNDDRDVVTGHGSHVGGILAGNCLNTEQDKREQNPWESDGNDFNIFNSMTPHAKLVVADLHTEQGGLRVPQNITLLLTHAKQHGAKISSHSWGCTLTQRDGPTACNINDEPRAEVLEEWLYTNQDVLMVVSSSNEGMRGYGTIGWLNNRKNVIGVGSLASGTSLAQQNAEDNGEAFYNTPSAYDALDNTFEFSSMGPAYDGRIKPDVVGVGHLVQSVNSGDPQETCGVTYMTGTSMAAPSISSLLGVMQQMLLEGRFGPNNTNVAIPNQQFALHKDDISSTLLRALLTNSAQPVYYRGQSVAAYPSPMRKQIVQTWSATYQGATYPALTVGVESTNLLDLVAFTTPKRFAVRPTPLTNDTTVTTTTRSFRLVLSGDCNIQYEIKAFIQRTPSVVETFITDFSTFTPQLFDITNVLLTDTVLFEITASVPPIDPDPDAWNPLPTCVTDAEDDGSNNIVEMVVLEFTGKDVVESSQRYQVATCDTVMTAFPSISSSGYKWDQLTIQCPPAPACTDTQSPLGRKLYGYNTYTRTTPLCRAALHNNVVDSRAAFFTEDDATAAIANNPKQYVLINRMMLYAAMNVRAAFSTHNDVATSSATIPAGQEAFTVSPLGDAEIEYFENIGASGVEKLYNNKLYLKEIQENKPQRTINTTTFQIDIINTNNGQGNIISGYGRPMLSSVLPLQQYLLLNQEVNTTQWFSRRELLILSNGVLSSLTTTNPAKLNTNDKKSNFFAHHKAFNNQDNAQRFNNYKQYCFYISHKPLINQYQVFNTTTTKYTGDGWTSGEDNISLTMVYHDAPAALLSLGGGFQSSLINNLNLFLFAPNGAEYRGNGMADDVNNVERITLPPNTFNPGLACAVVHNVQELSVLTPYQPFSLVANGRGITTCNETNDTTNPLLYIGSGKKKTLKHMNGIWKRVNITAEGREEEQVAECTTLQDENDNNDITKSTLYTTQYGEFLQIKQVGECFNIHNVIQENYRQNSLLENQEYDSNKNLYPTHNLFNAQRLSSIEYELMGDFATDAKLSPGHSASGTTFVMSGQVQPDELQLAQKNNANQFTFPLQYYQTPKDAHNNNTIDPTQIVYKTNVVYTPQKDEMVLEVNYFDIDNYQFPQAAQHLKQTCTFKYKLEKQLPML